MRTLFALLMLTIAAHAQTAIGTSKPWEQPSGGMTIPIVPTGVCTHPSGVCPMPEVKVRSYLDDEELAKIKRAVAGTILWCGQQEYCSVTGGANAPTIRNYTPKCEDGWSLVDTGGRPMCAKELREPK